MTVALGAPEIAPIVATLETVGEQRGAAVVHGVLQLIVAATGDPPLGVSVKLDVFSVEASTSYDSLQRGQTRSWPPPLAKGLPQTRQRRRPGAALAAGWGVMQFAVIYLRYA